MLLKHQENLISGSMKPLVEIWTDSMSGDSREIRKQLKNNSSRTISSLSLISPWCSANRQGSATTIIQMSF